MLDVNKLSNALLVQRMEDGGENEVVKRLLARSRILLTVKEENDKILTFGVSMRVMDKNAVDQTLQYQVRLPVDEKPIKSGINFVRKKCQWRWLT